MEVNLSSDQNRTNDSISFVDSEIVIGLVGAVGTNLKSVVEDLKNELELCRYSLLELRVLSEIILSLVDSTVLREKNDTSKMDCQVLLMMHD